jgi:hypothetical protein
MVPGTAERDRFTSREQWNDWWRDASPPAACGLHRVNTWAPGAWLATRLRQWRSGQKRTRAGWGWVRHAPGVEALTRY